MKKNNNFQTTIRCKCNYRGNLDFYISRGDEEFFLYTQNFKNIVYDFYKRGVGIRKALDHSQAGDYVALHKTMDKLFKVIKYVEKDECVSFLDRTQMRKERKWA